MAIGVGSAIISFNDGGLRPHTSILSIENKTWTVSDAVFGEEGCTPHQKFEQKDE